MRYSFEYTNRNRHDSKNATCPLPGKNFSKKTFVCRTGTNHELLLILGGRSSSPFDYTAQPLSVENAYDRWLSSEYDRCFVSLHYQNAWAHFSIPSSRVTQVELLSRNDAFSKTCSKNKSIKKNQRTAKVAPLIKLNIVCGHEFSLLIFLQEKQILSDVWRCGTTQRLSREKATTYRFVIFSKVIIFWGANHLPYVGHFQLFHLTQLLQPF